MNTKMANEGNLGLDITELRLGLPGDIIIITRKSRVSSEVESDLKCEPATKSQVVVWPPVFPFRRKNSLRRDNDLVNETEYRWSCGNVQMLPRSRFLSTNCIQMLYL